MPASCLLWLTALPICTAFILLGLALLLSAALLLAAVKKFSRYIISLFFIKKP